MSCNTRFLKNTARRWYVSWKPDVNMNSLMYATRLPLCSMHNNNQIAQKQRVKTLEATVHFFSGEDKIITVANSN